jgi:hypothetical protein
MHRGARRRWSSLVGAAACTLREAMRERFRLPMVTISIGTLRERP